MSGPGREEIATVIRGVQYRRGRWVGSNDEPTSGEYADALIEAGLFDRAPDTAPAEAADRCRCGPHPPWHLNCSECGKPVAAASSSTLRAALAAPPVPSTTDAAVAFPVVVRHCPECAWTSAAASSSSVSDPAAGEA